MGTIIRSPVKLLAIFLILGCVNSGMKITSPSFENNGAIPERFTCDGKDVNPKLMISEIPGSAKTLALIMDDPDAPMGTWVHWVMWNIPPGNIPENSTPGTQGLNSWGRKRYGGPCPPSGVHHYFFKVYALDCRLNLPEGATKEDLLKAMEGHIIEKAELIGTYQRSS